MSGTESDGAVDEAGGSVAERLLTFGDDYSRPLLLLFAVVLALPPLFFLDEGFYMTVMTEMFLFGVLALSWDLVGGQTGYPSFGNMAFFGVGAYTTGILWKDMGVAYPAALLAAGVLAVAFAVVIGLAVLRLRGHYFAIATLGVLLASIQISRYLEITGGSSGKVLLGGPGGETFYYLFLGLLVAEMAVVRYLTGTRFGFVLNAIRDDERKATAMGINTTYYKTAAWTLAALFTGLAGGAYGAFNTFIDPQTAYNLAWNVELIAMALLGGTGTVAGPVLGAFGLHVAIVEIDSLFSGWQLIILGTVVIVTVIAFPNGVVGSLRERASAMEYYKFGGGAAGDSSSSASSASSASSSAGGSE
jgi:branched-chain amino acid transport system permease protein